MTSYYESQTNLSNIDKPDWIAGFWRRVLAYCLDTALLAVICFIIGSFFREFFFSIGQWGKLVGFSLGLIYFSFFNSALGGGQTIGKRLLKIKVINFNNKPINLSLSALRYLALGIPFLLNNAIIGNEALRLIIAYPLSLIVLGTIFSNIYLIIFNRHTRQLPHDLLFKTMVVKEYEPVLQNIETKKLHLILIGCIYFSTLIMPAAGLIIVKKYNFDQLNDIQKLLANQEGIKTVQVSKGVTNLQLMGENSQTTHFISAHIQVKNQDVNDHDFSQHQADLIAQNYPEILNQDVIIITLYQGYNLGYWKSNNFFTKNYNITQ